jgi:hypothetical protein
MAAAPADPLEPLMAAVLYAGPGSAISHLSAAAVLGIPSPTPREIHLTTPRDIRTAPAGLHVHRCVNLDAAETDHRSGIPITSAARTVIDLAGELSPADLRIALDAARRQGASLARIEWSLKRVGRVKGGRTLRQMIDECRAAPPTESVLEAMLEQLLRDAGLPPPQRQFRVFDNGRVIARIDFAYPGAMLANRS